MRKAFRSLEQSLDYLQMGWVTGGRTKIYRETVDFACAREFNFAGIVLNRSVQPSPRAASHVVCKNQLRRSFLRLRRSDAHAQESERQQ
ncbi:hypothetical protein UNPF46_23935 [Bradyrhizobium sp. UNPF46]|nr:hypothetical protein UNPF46_23935 [Bradyrhizobium sp. UNPF46]